jgi:hypothetical protein
MTAMDVTGACLTAPRVHQYLLTFIDYFPSMLKPLLFQTKLPKLALQYVLHKLSHGMEQPET